MNVTGPMIALWVLFASLTASAETAEEKGLRITKAADAFNAGFAGETSTMEMILTNAHGDTTTRKMSSKILEGTDDGDRSIITFVWPADVKGTRMLTWTHKVGNDDQWLYLPSIKRVKRISSRNKSGAFMGSEFAYEDLGSSEIEKYTYTWLKDEELQGRKQWVIQRIPTDKRSGYTKQVMWLDQQYHQPLKIDFYDRKGDLLKTFTFVGYTAHGKHWRAKTIDALNHQTRKKSKLDWANRKLGVAPQASEFSKDALSDW